MMPISRSFKFLVVLIVISLSVGFSAFAQEAVCDPTVDYLVLGNDNYNAGSYQEAVNSFTCALQQHPSSAAIYNGRGNAYRNLGNLQAAINDYTRAIELEPQYAMVYNNRGWAYLQTGQLDNALSDLNRAIEIDSSLAFAYNNRGLVYQAMGDYDLAINDFNTAIQLGHEPLSWPQYNLEQALFERDKLGLPPITATPTVTETGTLAEIEQSADQYFSNGEYDKAVEAYGRVIEFDPTNANAYFNRAESYRQLGQTEPAIENYTLAITNGYSDPGMAYFERGWLYVDLDQYEVAVEDFTSMVEVNPQDSSAYFSRSFAYGRLEDYQKAIDDAKLAIEYGFDDPIVYNNMGNYYYELGDYMQALENYNQALGLDPDYGLALRNRGGLYVDMGYFDLAETDLNRAVELEPYDADHLLSRGILYLKTGRDQLAAADFVTRFDLIETDRVDGEALVPGDMRSLEMQEGRVYHIPFTGEIGQVITVTASSPDVDSLLVILDPEGQPLTAHDDISDDNYDAAIINYSLPANGTYTLLVGHAGGGSEGTVELDFGGALSVDELNNRAYAYRQQGSYDLAVNLYSKVIEMEPDNATAFYNRGDAYANLYNNQAAISDFTRAIELDDGYVDAYQFRGVVHERMQEYDLALADYNRAIELNPSYLIAYFGRGNVYLAMKDYEAAVAAFDSVLQLNPNYVGAYHNRGWSYALLGEYQKAIDDYNRAMELDPSYAFLVALRADAYLKLGEFDQAIEDYNTSLEVTPTNCCVYLGRGIAYIGLGDRATAAADFMKWFDGIQIEVVSGDPIEDGKSVELDMAQGKVYRLPFAGEAGQVVTFHATSEDADPLLVVLGVNGEPLTADDDDGGDLNALISEFELPDTGEYTLVLGHAGGGSLGKIKVIFGSEQAVSDLIDSADAYRAQYNYSQAIEEYTQALALDPQNGHAYFYRGFCYGEIDEYEKSVADYNQAIEYGFSPIEWAYADRGWSYRKLGEYEKAIADFDRAIEINPEYGLAYYNRGYTYAQMGEHEKAVEDYTRALDFDPNDADILYNRALSYGELGEYEKSIADYTASLDNGYEYPGYIHDNIGWTYRKMGNYDRAIEEYTLAIESDPGDAGAYYGRGYIYNLMEDYQKAIDDYTTALALGYDIPADIYYNRGETYADLGEWALAKADFTEALKVYPTDDGLFLSRGITYIHLGKLADAARDFMEWFDLIVVNRLDHEPIAVDDTVTLEMSEGTVYYIPFNGEMGQTVTFTATSPDADPLLVILNANGDPLTADDDSAGDLNAVISKFELPDTGAYTLVVGHAGGGSEGTITLTFGEVLSLDQLKSRAQTYRSQDEFELAIQDYTQILEMEPDNASVYFDRGYSYAELGDYENALADYNLTIEYGFTPLEWAYHNRGLSYINMGDYEKALADLNRALELAPEFAQAYLSRGFTYYLMDEPEKAIADYNQALDLNFSHPTYVYTARANAYLDLEEWTLAEADYSTALIAEPDDASSYLGRGIAYVGMDDRVTAGSDFMQWFDLIETDRIEEPAVEFGSTVTLAMAEGRVFTIPFTATAGQVVTVSATSAEADPLVVILDTYGYPISADDDDGGDLNALVSDVPLLESGSYTLVVGHAGGGSEGSVEVSLEVAPADSVESLKALALSQIGDEDYEGALSTLDQAIEIDPQDAESFIYRGAVYGFMEDYEKAVSDYSEAIALGYAPVEDAYALRARFYLEMGEWQLAKGDYSIVLAIVPDDASSYLGRGIAYANLEERASAGADFMKWFKLVGNDRIDEDAIEIGDTVTVDMTAGRTYAIPFTGEAGTRVTISATSYYADPLVVLLDAEGKPLTADDDGGGGLDSLIDGFDLPSDGSYTIIVGHAGGGSEGPIDVELSFTGGAGIV